MIGGSMLRRGQTTTFPERLDIIERATAGQSDPEIAATLGCSVWTVRTWRSLGQHQGRTGLSSQMGRPVKGPLATLPTGMRETILQMRRMHPGWGSTTLLAELQVDARWTDQPLPSRSRIAAGLRTEHLTRRYQKHSELPIPVIQPEGAPHDEWELDAQGSMQVAGIGKVCLITMIDVVSRWHRSRAISASIRPIPPVARLSTHAETCLPDLWTAPAHLVGSRNRLLRQHLAVAVSHQSASVVAG